MPDVRNNAAADPYVPPDDAIILRIAVKEVEYTDYHPSCADPNNCVPFYFWYKYRARVREVIAGEWRASEVAFTHLQHAEYLEKLTRDCYVILQPASQDLQSKIGVPFVANQLLFDRPHSDP